MMEIDTSWDDPQLSDGDMPIRIKNTLKNTFPDLESKSDLTVNDLDNFLIKVSEMDKVGIRRKIILLEGFIHKLKNNIKP